MRAGTCRSTTRTLGRAVSLLDYEDFARAFTRRRQGAGAGAAAAAGPTIAITMAGPDGAPSPREPGVDQPARCAQGQRRSARRGALLSYQASTFRLGLKVKRDPDLRAKAVLAAVEAALRAHFAFERATRRSRCSSRT